MNFHFFPTERSGEEFKEQKRLFPEEKIYIYEEEEEKKEDKRKRGTTKKI